MLLDASTSPSRYPRGTRASAAGAGLPTLAALVTLALVIGLVSPATPASASGEAYDRGVDEACAVVGDFDPAFRDLDGLAGPVEQAVLCLAYYDITSGTAPGAYGPAQAVSRVDMAVFLSRVLAHGDDSGDLELPEPIAQGFADVDGLSEERREAIDLLGTLGITGGTGDGTRFSPFDTVTRRDMASFLVRLQDVIDGGSDSYQTDARHFVDVAEDLPRADDIDRLASQGIVQGGADGTYGPFQPVLRSQMALFIMRHLDENISAGRLRAAAPGRPSPAVPYARITAESDEAIAVTDMASAADGGLVVAGWFTGTASFDGRRGEGGEGLTPYVLALDERGNARWLHTGTGAAPPSAVAAAPDGGAIVVGTFEGAVTFGETTLRGPDTAEDAASVADSYAVRLTADGDVDWASHVARSDAFVGPNDVAVGDDGNALVVGRFSQGAATFGSIEVEGPSGDAGYLAALDTDGDLAWAESVGSPENIVTGANAVTATPDGGFAVAGEFAGTVDFGGPSLTAEGGPLLDDGFVLKVTADGATSWARHSGASAEGQTSPTAIASTSAGDLVVVGTFEQTTRFGLVTLEGGARSTAYSVGLKADGEQQWVTQPASLDDEDRLAPTSLVLADDGRAIVAGVFEGTVDVGAERWSSAGGSDGFLLALDADGGIDWARHAVESASPVTVTGLAATADGGAVVGGALRAPARVGSTSLAVDAEAAMTPLGGIRIIAFDRTFAATVAADGAMP